MTDLRYPLPKFQPPAEITSPLRSFSLHQIGETPAKLRAAVKGMTDEQLNTPYREGGWTVRQVVHHVPDSHLNAYVRTRLALTEENPTIKAYHENLWAELPDAKSSPVAPSLLMLESLHTRWMILLRTLKPADFAKTFKHPERGDMTLDSLLALYAWHGQH